MERDSLTKIYKEMLDEKIISALAENKGIDLRKAMDIYYQSQLAEQIHEGRYCIENMDYKYLVEDLIENEPELFK
ncbi:MAG: hypothetical protein II180_02645 [Proteobacteria bacterium]|nr:hypothetical protein [Pseudomonadota bacterium]